jgi:hypothetical protein
MTKKSNYHFQKKHLVDPDTGESFPVVLSVENVNADQDFSKVWLKEFLNKFQDISNKKTKVALWIIDHLDSQNRLLMTQQQVADKTGFGFGTVKRTFWALISNDFLRKIPGGYQINPEIIFRGTRARRMAICQMYENQSQKAPDLSDRIDTITKTISRLTKELIKLQNEQKLQTGRKWPRADDEDEIEEFLRRHPEYITNSPELKRAQEELDEETEEFLRQHTEAIIEEPQMQQAAEEPDDTKHRQHE